MRLKGTSRLSVLMVTAIYRTIETTLGEQVLALQAHNAADTQTGALGDVEITLIDAQDIITCYEMKNKRVVQADIDRALQKISAQQRQLDNYIFITTEPIDPSVQHYTSSLYELTGGIEVAILDCIGFIRHFLHLFHRHRGDFLEHYQHLILSEPDSGLSQPLKEAFLAMRHAAESGE